MRLTDLIFRQGHLSEQALTDALLTGNRPHHLDRCDICGDRALEMSRWLDEVKSVSTRAADEAFPVERLAAQQAQILRRLEQADAPPRVIEFPLQLPAAARAGTHRRVAPAWIGVAAAAGMVVGVLGSELATRHTAHAVTPAAASATVVSPAQVPANAPAPSIDRPNDGVAANASLMDLDLEGFTPDTLRMFDEATPRLVQTRLTTVANVR